MLVLDVHGGWRIDIVNTPITSVVDAGVIGLQPSMTPFVAHGCGDAGRRRIPQPLAAATQCQTFATLAKSRAIRWIYDKWFVRPLPDGVRLRMPMGPQLTTIFEVQGLPP